jgi:SAM-dependent methyltransferase
MGATDVSSFRNDDCGSYVFGHSDQELERLNAQARLIDPITERIFRSAGVATGMRVLDVGSGAGDVAFLAAQLVGETGEVIGVDRSAIAVQTATSRAATRGLDNVSFRLGDPAEMVFDKAFDAVIGRYVLMFQTDPAAMLRDLVVHARPGGSIVFHEVDWDGAFSLPPAPIYDRCRDWIIETLRASNVHVRMGLELPAAFEAAGLPSPLLRLEALIGAGEHAVDALELVADITGTLSPTMERLGVATSAEIGYDTLVARMTDQARANSSLIVGRSEIGAWSHLSL